MLSGEPFLYRLNRRRSVVCGGVAFVLGALVLFFPVGGGLRLAGYDLLVRNAAGLSRPPKGWAEVAIVTMDHTDFNRSDHARLIGKLVEAEVKAIVFDVFFKDSKELSTDQELMDAATNAITNNVPVIFAADLDEQDDGTNTQLIPPFQELADALQEIAKEKEYPDADFDPPFWGHVDLSLHKGDEILRQYHQDSRGLTRKAFERAGGTRLPSEQEGDARWIHYHDGGRSITKVPFDAVLQGRNRDDLKNKVVFVGQGRLAENGVAFRDQKLDVFATPLAPEVPGVFLHAIIYANLASAPRGWLASPLWLNALLLVSGVCLAVWCGRLTWRGALGLCLAAVAAVVLLTLFLFAAADLWFSWLAVVVLLIPLAWLMSLAPVNDAFLSYRNDDAGRQLAEGLKKCLATHGVACFFDQQASRAGELDDDLSRNVAARPNFLLILTPGALTSEWIAKEIRRARASRRCVIPVYAEHLDLAFDLASVPEAYRADVEWAATQNYRVDMEGHGVAATEKAAQDIALRLKGQIRRR